LAVSDELGVMAHARPPLAGRDLRKLLAELCALAKREGIERFLVGLPLDRMGDEGGPATRSRRFAQALANASGREVELVDERLTTVEASRRLREGGVSAKRGKPLVDGVAAAVILQSWLDGRRRFEP
jgi:putative Holliday junction resolvase